MSNKPLFLILPLLFGVLTTSLAQDRIALVIGNDNYAQMNPLKNARNDAKLVAKTLKNLGFQVTEISDGSINTIYEGLNNLKAQGKDKKLILFYFAGHGMEIEKKNYIIPTDAKLETRSHLRTETIPLDTILRDLASTGAEAKMVVLDACRDNPLQGTRSWMRTRSAGVGLAPVEPPESTLIMYSAGPGQQASDGADNGENSPFSSAFAKSIQNPNKNCMMVFFDVTDEVLEKTGYQTPWVEFDGAANAFRNYNFFGDKVKKDISPIVDYRDQEKENMREELAKLRKKVAKMQKEGHSPVNKSFQREPNQIEISADESIEVFLHKWWNNQKSNSAYHWASDFTPNPDYCYWEKGGYATRSFIQENRQKLINKYPYREYEQLGKAAIKWFDDYSRALLQVSYHYNYSGKKTTQGNAFITMELQKQPNGEWKISSYDENVRRNAYHPNTTTITENTYQPPPPPPSNYPKTEESIKKELLAFVNDWLDNAVSNNPSDWTTHFLENTRYVYNNGKPTPKSKIKDSRRKLINKYPHRTYRILNVDYKILQNGEIQLKIYYAYDYQKTSGRCTETLLLGNTAYGLKVKSFHEKVH